MNYFDAENFMRAGEVFYDAIHSELLAMGIAASDLKPDHLCFRVATEQEYDFYKHELLALGALLSEATINGRPISTLRLAIPFATRAGEIPVVEVPAPKWGSPYPTKFEHAEFVIDENFEDFCRKYPAHEFKASFANMNNPELSLTTCVGQAKFHHATLADVIEGEHAADQNLPRTPLGPRS